ncbi:MFS transporter [Paraburkholderia flagellata]|uniref:MFS transporter n=1 Tax=Paraburkholderia flagellata TaxID=2883241 RepID=UPI001F2597DD|nr:MFS transporter [Paraburkholderia flagellata]
MDIPESEIAPALADSASEREALYRRVTLRLVPFLFVCYLVAMIDRTSVGYAKLQFLTELGFSEAAYGLGAGLFFAGYVVFEVPSNIYLNRFGVRRTILRIMVAWGLATTLMFLVRTPTQFYLARFLLGVAEGGFFPGILLYITYWFPADKKGRIYAMFMLSNPFSGLVGGVIAGAIMSGLDGAFGLHGWQMLFIGVGVPAIALGIIAFFYLPDGPEQARWLTPDEKQYIAWDVAKSRASATPSKTSALGRALLNRRVWIAAAAYFTLVSAVTVLSLWGPSIIKSLGVHDVGMVGFVSAVPYTVGCLSMYLVGRNSDRVLERRWHFIFCSLMAAAGALLLATVHGHTAMSILFISMIAFGVYGEYAVFFTMPAAFLEGAIAPAGLAIITTVGSLGGFVTPALIGWVKSATGSLDYGIALSGLISIAGAVLVWLGIPARLMRAVEQRTH